MLNSYRASLEGREITIDDIMSAQTMKEVIEGTCDTTLEIYRDILMFIDGILSSLPTPMSIDECYDIIYESLRLDILWFEQRLEFYKECENTLSDLKVEFLTAKDSSSLLENFDLGFVLDVDMILNEIKHPKVEIEFGCEDVFYMVNGDEVDYFVMNSFTPEIDFIFPLNAFDPPKLSIITEYFTINATFVVDFLDNCFLCLLMIIVCDFSHIVHCVNRRRTKGPLVQPFDSHD